MTTTHSSSAARKGARKRDVLAGNSPDLQLYRAVRRYVEDHGGSVLVIGGIEIQSWPGDPEGAFRVAVRVVGHRPTKGAK